jgi:hypothetical protein
LRPLLYCDRSLDIALSAINLLLEFAKILKTKICERCKVMITTETSTQSDIRQSLIQEIELTSDSVLSEVLDFLLFVRAKHSQAGLNINAGSYEADEDYEDIEDAKAALASVDSEGTISWESLKAEIGL